MLWIQNEDLERPLGTQLWGGEGGPRQKCCHRVEKWREGEEDKKEGGEEVKWL